MQVTIERGQALVLVGPQGCGKTVLARRLAASAGRYVEVDAFEMQERDGLNDVLLQEPLTCIVDGFPAGAKLLQRLKGLITNGEAVCVRRPFDVHPKRVRPPNFIFCVNDSKPFDRMDGRRFRVVRMGTSEDAGLIGW